MSNSTLGTSDDSTAQESRSDTDSPTDTPTDVNARTDIVLELDGISKSYGTESVIDDLSLSVQNGEILTLLGPSGCGKTTTLRLIAGLDRPDRGEVRLNGSPVSGNGSFVAPEERGVGVVFQEFALFPHLTAAENIAFGLKHLSKSEREARVDELLDLVGLETQGESYPDELSGGQQQRVALARSLAPEPAILLLDEPFSNLDVDLRVQMREEVRRILKEAGVTAVSVTHDQEEAMSISDRVAVMNDGKLEQIGEPEQVFQHPESRFVASFLGYAGFLPGHVSGDVVKTELGTVPRDQIHGLAAEYDETDIDILVRPDDVSAHACNGSGHGEVVGKRYLGPTILYEVELDGGDNLLCMHNHDETVPTDGRVEVSLDAGHELAWFPSEQRPESGLYSD
ncbi:ABC transporter ATP-binding protein [Haloferax larsenii]|uniref:Molybdate/tungstate import ATP-binding protein WtpC n=1 Tax=Haloferax larsenii TaxID=302484 RepID=A0A1H7SET4_HALLR|nr:ABC transporter ATP-binding protein [Haloferax larsenii]ELZ81532.1 iron(III) transport system ATP-binding protein [Haloferax larsenii JCM 13917]UVE49953.1 ABC transporter ATP-binding protein [Haloferax larsenii]SEL70234.1 iron(III) transport system ATP-binding protein [Haloferax larsenii]